MLNYVNSLIETKAWSDLDMEIDRSIAIDFVATFALLRVVFVSLLNFYAYILTQLVIED